MSGQAFRPALSLLSRFLEDATVDDNDHEDESSSLEMSKPWGDALLGAFLVFFVTFTGLGLVAVTRCFPRLRQNSVLQTLAIPSFAAGALLATTVFLLVPEALTLLMQGGTVKALDASAHDHTTEEEEQGNHTRYTRWLEEEAEGDAHAEMDEHEGENGVAWKFGASLLAGFLFPVILHSVFSPAIPVEQAQSKEPSIEADLPDGSPEKGDAVSGPLVPKDEETELACGCCESSANETGDERVKPWYHVDKKSLDIPTALSLSLGDLLHNLSDGIFIGAAFVLCTKDLAYTIVATTIYHEIAQELSDFVLLTHKCGFPVWLALLVNAICGLSVVLGVVIILSADMTNQGIGIILSISAGVYLHIAAVECMAKVQGHVHGFQSSLTTIGCFVLGAIPIGLVLLNHGHCEGEH